MIVGVTASEQRDDPLDAASTHTLVVDRWHTIPRHLLMLTYLSIFLSTIAFIFGIMDNVFTGLLPRYIAMTVLTYVFTLPYHGATILLAWLQKHETASIFPFPPSHPHTVAYSFGLVGLWVACAAFSVANLIRSSGLRELCLYSYLPDNAVNTTMTKCFTTSPQIINFWTSIASTLAFSLELIAMVSIASTCYRQCRQKISVSSSDAEASLTPQDLPRERKVLSA